MKESTLFKMIVISMFLHVILVGALSIQFKKNGKRINLPYYSVNLIADAGDGGGATRASEPPKHKEAAPPLKPKAEPAKQKPILNKKEKERSLAPKQKEKLKEKEKPVEPKKDVSKATKDDVKNLSEKIKQMKKKTEYLEVVGGASGTSTQASGQGIGGGRPTDLRFAGYINEVREKILEVWRVPSSARSKNIQANVTIKIRDDGRITGWNIDEGSGNKLYDESINRALRMLVSLPPPPEPYGEIPLAFRPMD